MLIAIVVLLAANFVLHLLAYRRQKDIQESLKRVGPRGSALGPAVASPGGESPEWKGRA